VTAKRRSRTVGLYEDKGTGKINFSQGWKSKRKKKRREIKKRGGKKP
jgi:hypothetical protein